MERKRETEEGRLCEREKERETEEGRMCVRERERGRSVKMG